MENAVVCNETRGFLDQLRPMPEYEKSIDAFSIDLAGDYYPFSNFIRKLTSVAQKINIKKLNDIDFDIFVGVEPVKDRNRFRSKHRKPLIIQKEMAAHILTRLKFADTCNDEKFKEIENEIKQFLASSVGFTELYDAAFDKD